MKRSRKAAILLTFCGILSLQIYVTAGPLEGTTVIIVRHAEKVDSSYDAALSAAGLRRAEFLADLLSRSSVEALVATQFRRTQDTLRPLADRLDLEIQIVDDDEPDALLEKIRRDHSGETVVVASHSNRIPQIIEKLNAGRISPIEEYEYDTLYLVTLLGPKKGSLLNLTVSQEWLD